LAYSINSVPQTVTYVLSAVSAVEKRFCNYLKFPLKLVWKEDGALPHRERGGVRVKASR
jgi:hypothetical protein